MFKFLFKSKFLGFVEAPVGVSFTFIRMAGCSVVFCLVLLLFIDMSVTEEVNPMVRVIKGIGNGKDDLWSFQGKVSMKLFKLFIW